MPVAIKSVAQIAEKWRRVTPQRSEDFAQGVQNPRKDWKGQTLAAAANYAAAIQQAITGKRYDAGVNKAGTEKWQRKTLQKGVNRWAEGVNLAADDYQTGFAKYRDVIARLDLPPRYPTGDPRNIQRVAAIAAALNKAKTAGGA